MFGGSLISSSSADIPSPESPPEYWADRIAPPEKADILEMTDALVMLAAFC